MCMLYSTGNHPRRHPDLTEKELAVTLNIADIKSGFYVQNQFHNLSTPMDLRNTEFIDQG